MCIIGFNAREPIRSLARRFEGLRHAHQDQQAATFPMLAMAATADMITAHAVSLRIALRGALIVAAAKTFAPASANEGASVMMAPVISSYQRDEPPLRPNIRAAAMTIA
ncbi:hypothetical protein C1632_12980 [Microbacterium testaceum]|nr:hypothetical protein C1632_12980 [Microbacterium testaceum]